MQEQGRWRQLHKKGEERMENLISSAKIELQHIKTLRQGIGNIYEEYLRGTLVSRQENGETIYYQEISEGPRQNRKKQMVRLGNINSRKLHDFIRAKLYKGIMSSTLKDEKIIENILLNYQDLSFDGILKRQSGKIRKALEQAEINILPENKGNKWMNQTYNKNPMPFANPHITITGEPVRSKGEAIIHNLLTLENIPFRYECELVLESNGIERKYYPDFTIRGGDGKLYYIEYSGMVSDQNYLAKFVDKLRTFYNNKITINRNLFLIFDDSDGSLDMEMTSSIIRKIIKPRTE